MRKKGDSLHGHEAAGPFFFLFRGNDIVLYCGYLSAEGCGPAHMRMRGSLFEDRRQKGNK